MKEEKRYAYLRHTMANHLHDKVIEGEKIAEIEMQLDFFLTEAIFVLHGARIDEKTLS